MIRSHFGLDQNPFANDTIALLPQQQEVQGTLRVHCQQGGLCVVIGDPGTGKSVIKQALIQHDPKRLIVPVVNRTLHTYPNVLRILCQAFQVDSDGQSFRIAPLATSQGLLPTPDSADTDCPACDVARRLAISQGCAWLTCGGSSRRADSSRKTANEVSSSLVVHFMTPPQPSLAWRTSDTGLLRWRRLCSGCF